MANVVPIAIHLDRYLLPHYLLRYLPSIPEVHWTPQQIVVVGFFASKFIPSGSELLMNYPDAFDLYNLDGKDLKISWLVDGDRIDEEYLIKREYYFDVPASIKKIINNRLPLNMRLDFTKKHQAMLTRNDALIQAIVDGQKKDSLPGVESDRLN